MKNAKQTLSESISSKREVLARMKNVIENVPKGDVLKIEENSKIVDVVERILKLINKFNLDKA